MPLNYKIKIRRMSTHDCISKLLRRESDLLAYNGLKFQQLCSFLDFAPYNGLKSNDL